MVLDSLASVVATGLGAVAAVFASLWARQRYATMKTKLDLAQSSRDAVDHAAERLAAVRKTQAAPVNPQQRTDFEKQP